MGKRYFAWSFDDGLRQDIRIVEILRKYKIGATFNLNSNMFGRKQRTVRLGNMGFKDVAPEEIKKGFFSLPYVSSDRLTEEEAVKLYDHFEIAAHTCNHLDLTKLNRQQAKEEMLRDKEKLEKIFSRPVIGLAYPFGKTNNDIEELAKECGFQYARTVAFQKSVTPPKEEKLLRLPITGWHCFGNVFKQIDQFVKTDVKDSDLLFVMFAHGYEFDYGTGKASWEKFESMCRLLQTYSKQGDIVCLSVGDALRQMGAIEN